jgi:hypothetical protein
MLGFVLSVTFAHASITKLDSDSVSSDCQPTRFDEELFFSGRARGSAIVAGSFRASQESCGWLLNELLLGGAENAILTTIIARAPLEHNGRQNCFRL